jgi:hypothetical protein
VKSQDLILQMHKCIRISVLRTQKSLYFKISRKRKKRGGSPESKSMAFYSFFCLRVTFVMLFSCPRDIVPLYFDCLPLVDWLTNYFLFTFLISKIDLPFFFLLLFCSISRGSCQIFLRFIDLFWMCPFWSSWTTYSCSEPSDFNGYRSKGI